jgi:Protein of unknown function (DUF1116)
MLEHANQDFALPFSQARWIDVVARATACPELPPKSLLHAGPPFRGTPPAPVVNAAIQAILFDGLAADAAEARALLRRGEVELLPAQDYRIATPLAQVVSASMLLFAVKQNDTICYAPVIEGSAPALRFGSLAPASRQRLRDVSAWVESSVAPRVRHAPVAIDALIRSAVAAGDECHAKTSAANEALILSVPGLEGADVERLRAMPAFVLPLLMAASCAAMRTRLCDIEAIGGNGIEFGVRRRGDRRWRQLPAQAPRGTRLNGEGAPIPLPAIGDSAVIDFCGLGGQALSAAPILASEWSTELPADALMRRQCLIDPETGIVDAARVERSGLSPLINLAILDREGAAGLIGRGFYAPPIELFSSRLTPAG